MYIAAACSVPGCVHCNISVTCLESYLKVIFNIFAFLPQHLQNGCCWLCILKSINNLRFYTRKKKRKRLIHFMPSVLQHWLQSYINFVFLWKMYYVWYFNFSQMPKKKMHATAIRVKKWSCYKTYNLNFVSKYVFKGKSGNKYLQDFYLFDAFNTL